MNLISFLKKTPSELPEQIAAGMTAKLTTTETTNMTMANVKSKAITINKYSNLKHNSNNKNNNNNNNNNQHENIDDQQQRNWQSMLTTATTITTTAAAVPVRTSAARASPMDSTESINMQMATNTANLNQINLKSLTPASTITTNNNRLTPPAATIASNRNGSIKTACMLPVENYEKFPRAATMPAIMNQETCMRLPLIEAHNYSTPTTAQTTAAIAAAATTTTTTTAITKETCSLAFRTQTNEATTKQLSILSSPGPTPATVAAISVPANDTTTSQSLTTSATQTNNARTESLIVVQSSATSSASSFNADNNADAANVIVDVGVAVAVAVAVATDAVADDNADASDKKCKQIAQHGGCLEHVAGLCTAHHDNRANAAGKPAVQSVSSNSSAFAREQMPESSYADKCSAQVTASSVKQSEQERFGCAHYKRRAMFVTPCCNKFYKCRFCHDENENHHFDRKTLTELICSECQTRQPVQDCCEHCGVRFGKYTCLICNLFDDSDKQQYHCNGCGICRIGGADNFFHCQVCNMCLPIRLKIDGHRCVENISRSHCPVCLGDIHTSRIPCHIPDCGHLLHKMCFDQLLKSGHYTCPICQTSLLDMTALWEYLDKQAVLMPMPKKYENQRIHIFCNDCHKTSKTKFHFIGLKCALCGAYNTTQDVKRRLSLVPDEPPSSA